MDNRSKIKMKKRKIKKPKFEIAMSNWNTTDADEIIRRKVRAEIEKFRIENCELLYPYFSTYYVGSKKKNKKYCVEIRSLIQTLNSCDCPDYRSNALGTCKHIEYTLKSLRRKGVKNFKQAEEIGSDRIEIYLESTSKLTVRIFWPKTVLPSIKKLLDPFFSSDDGLLGDPVLVFEELKKEVSRAKNLSSSIRISRHIQYFIDYQSVNSQKQHAKESFMRDVALKKRTLDVVKCPLFPYQQEGMLHLAFTERALLADEMGLGKTAQAIAACELLRQLHHIQRVLIVTTASLKAEWEEQIAKFTNLSSVVIFGTRAGRLKQYLNNVFFYLMNYEQVISDHAEIQRLLAPDVIILDEAQRIKNWQTKTANTVKELKSRYAFVLTGTPVENRIDDIYSIVQFLDPHIFGPLFRFNRDFYELDEDGRPIGYKNLDELYRRLRPIMLCRKKSDVEEKLPQRLINNYFVGMDSEQRIRYEEYEGYIARLLHVAKRRPLRKEEFEKLQKWLACMRMLCDTPYILDKDCRVSPKLIELQNILEEILGNPTTKIIIFSEWERMLHLVKAMLEKNDWEVAWHTGSVSQQKRRETIRQFKNDTNCRLFLSTDAGSLGLNLQVANVVINLDLPWNPAKLEQRIARAWRKHQTQSVQVINLICENSIEHRMLYLLEQKQLLANGILTGKSDLKAMKMPSGHAAFMERMEALMGNLEKYSAASHETKSVQEDSVVKEKIRDVFLEQAAGNFDLLLSYKDQQQEKTTLFAVCDSNREEIQKNLQQQIQSDCPQVEIVDCKTFETIQRLVNAGILSFNTTASVLYDKALPESRQQLYQKQVEQAKHYLAQAERKQKMVHLLAEGDFSKEAIPHLQEALKLSLKAFIHLLGESKNLMQEELSLPFIQEKLVDQYGLPKVIVPLFSQLMENSDESQDVKSLHAAHQAIICHVDETLNRTVVS